MASSILQYARDFELLKSRLQNEPEADNRILLLVDFWPLVEQFTDNPTFSSYFQEYTSLIADSVDGTFSHDLVPDELAQLNNVVDFIEGQSDSIQSTLKSARHWLATSFLHVGAIEECLRVLGFPGIADDQFKGIVNDPRIRPLELTKAALLVPNLPLIATDFLTKAVEEWERLQERSTFDSISCLFVEKGGVGKVQRGRIRHLTGHARLFLDGSVDEITFCNQLVGTEDPAIGALYKAVAAVKDLHRGQFNTAKPAHIHCHLSIEATRQAISGDSLGLAAALLVYIQVRRPDIRRFDNSIGSDLIVTGALDSDGTIAAINDGSLIQKVRRAFFSPYSVLVVPAVNVDAVNLQLSELRARFPHRHLQIVAKSHFAELLDDRNVVCAERVCIGQYVGRKAARWTRKIEVQIPMLAALAYLLVCLIYPKAWPWFDEKIAWIDFAEHSFAARNVSGQVIWESEPIETSIDSKALNNSANVRSAFVATDSDRDGKSELFVCPPFESSTSEVFYFGEDGKLLWRQPAFCITSYPGDTEYFDTKQHLDYNSACLIPFTDEEGKAYVVVSTVASPPARDQIRLFDESGPVNENTYLNPGYLGSDFRLLHVNQDAPHELVLWGNNNAYAGATLLVIDPLTADGVAPPYSGSNFISSAMTRGNQSYCVLFPGSPLIRATEGLFPDVAVNYDSATGSWFVRLTEGYRSIIGTTSLDDTTEYLQFHYSLDRNFIPTQVYAGQGSFELLNAYLKELGLSGISSLHDLTNSLLSQVIVYHGDSIVHHLADGVDFYRKD